MKLHWRIYIRENKVMIIHANRTDKNSALYRILFITIRRIFSTYTWNLERLHTNLQAITHEIPNGYTRISKWLHMKFRTVTHEFPGGYTWNSDSDSYTWISKRLHMKFRAVTHEFPRSYTWKTKIFNFLVTFWRPLIFGLPTRTVKKCGLRPDHWTFKVPRYGE